MARDQCCDLPDRSSAHETRGRRSDTDSRFQRVLDFNAHQRVEAQVSERLIITQRLWLYPKDRSDNFAHGMGDYGFLFCRCGGLNFVSPVTYDTGAVLVLDRREDALEQRVPLHASEECFPFRPIDSNGSDLRTARTKRGLNNRQHFAGRKFTDTLFGEKLGDAFVSRNIALSAEHTPVYR